MSTPAPDRIIDHIPAVVLSVGPDWRIRTANRSAEALFDRPAATVVGHELWEQAADLASWFYRPLARVLKTGETERFLGYYPPLERLYRVTAFPLEGGVGVQPTSPGRAPRSPSCARARSG